MTIIDERILIPTAPDVVWEIISNINDNTKWQANCTSISFLTSLRSGPGVRWRYGLSDGHEYVVETTAWYDGLGYEYTFIDGAPFRTSKGTLRLQEIPEGTIVQWTLNYELGGVLSGLRNALSVRRQFDKFMVDSLKGLWTYIKESGKSHGTHEAKSLMRDALDYEARAQYTPRHPSRYAEREAERPPVAEVERPEPLITEPPIADEDTRPNPILATESAAPAAEASTAEPEASQAAEVLAAEKMQVATEEEELARFRRPPEQPATPQQPTVAQEAAAPSEQPEEQPESASASGEVKQAEPVAEEAPAAVEPAPEPAAEPDAKPQPEPEPAAAPDTVDQQAQQPEPLQEQPQPASAEEFGPKIDTSKLDTREISIWEVFGVPSPSDTERMKAITDQQLAEADAAAKGEPASTGEPEPKPEAVPGAALGTKPAPAAASVTGEETRPNIPLGHAFTSTEAVILPGFRVRARRRLVKLRRRSELL